jgi:hypothetical protein
MLAFVVTAKQRVNVIDLVSRRASEIERLDLLTETVSQEAFFGATALGARDAPMAAVSFQVFWIFGDTRLVSSIFNGAQSLKVIPRPLESPLAVILIPRLGALLSDLRIRWVSTPAFHKFALMFRVLCAPFLAQHGIAAGVLRPPLLEIGRSTFTALSIPANRPSLIVKSVSALRAPKQKRPPVKLAPAWEGLADKLPEVNQRFI